MKEAGLNVNLSKRMNGV
jgi:hypothetical protein